MTMYETYQGIHVTFSTHKELEVLDETVEQTLIDTLILANIDFNKVEDIKLL